MHEAILSGVFQQEAGIREAQEQRWLAEGYNRKTEEVERAVEILAKELAPSIV